MSKRVTESETYELNREYGMNKDRHLVACDDGSLYVFECTSGDRWETYARVDSDGSRSMRPSRLPAAVEAHMEGFTYMTNSYWV